jgi:hypothetical protein
MRRLGGGGFSSYLGNGSEADIDDRREPEGWSVANQKASSCEDLLEKVLARDNLLTAWTATVRSTRKMA